MNFELNLLRFPKSMPSYKGLISTIFLCFFIILSILVTYPTAFKLNEFSILDTYTDDLLEAWTLKWDVHAILSGFGSARNVWNANIFYPYPTTLAFSEHLLATAFLLMPFTLLGSTPLVATNLGVILTTSLTGWGTYLLVTWLTGNRWAGLVAGIAFAIAPFRLGHITQLHLLSTHWIPFIFLVMDRLIRSNRRLDLILLVIFTNLQFFAVVNYAPLVAFALAVWTLVYLYTYRSRISPPLMRRLMIFAVVTLVLNWPILRLYQQVSERMDIVRTLGDAKVYGASIVNYILPMGNSLLYGRWLGLPTLIDYLRSGSGVSVSAFPGIVVLLLALVGLAAGFKSQANQHVRNTALASLIIVVLGFGLSFGANEEAFGQDLSSVVAHLLPYPYLYQAVAILEGLRVPIRFALLFTFGLAILAGIGFAGLSRRSRPNGHQLLAAALISLFIIVEHFPAPLPGVSVPYANEGYTWLAENSPQEAVILELPYLLHTERSQEELLREYQSTIHWRRRVNGSSGFEPDWLIKLGTVLDFFPDWRSFDVVRQLGVDHVMMHRDQYDPDSWNNIIALLPAYLPAIESIHTVGDNMILRLKPPECASTASDIQAEVKAFPVISIANGGPGTWVANPGLISEIRYGHSRQEFLEPLFVLPGQTVNFDLPVKAGHDVADWRVQLGNLEQTLTVDGYSNRHPTNSTMPSSSWQPVEVPFANKAVLKAITMEDSIATCAQINLSLRWTFASYADERVHVELIDQFDRLTLSHETKPVSEAEAFVSTHSLPLAETIPAGRYRLQVHLLAPDDTEITAVDPNGTPISQAVSMPIVVRPHSSDKAVSGQGEHSYFANKIILLGVEGLPGEAKSSDWLRFALVWQGQEAPITADYTVFTQLLGPDGQVWGQHDNPPKGGWYPTSLWAAGEIVVDDYAFQVDPAAPEGEYHLIVGMYDSATGERVGIIEGSGTGNNFVDIASLIVN
jgi:hypothetical protein